MPRSLSNPRWARVQNAVKVAFAALIILLTSCGSGKDIAAAQQGVGQFHSQLDSEQYHEIYAAADDSFHKATTETDFIALLQAIHRKLGKTQKSEQRTFQVGWYTGTGKTVTLGYDTNFAGGAASEQFVWGLRGDQPVLLGYHVTSNALITK